MAASNGRNIYPVVIVSIRGEVVGGDGGWFPVALGTAGAVVTRPVARRLATPRARPRPSGRARLTLAPPDGIKGRWLALPRPNLANHESVHLTLLARAGRSADEATSPLVISLPLCWAVRGPEARLRPRLDDRIRFLCALAWLNARPVVLHDQAAVDPLEAGRRV